MLPAALGFEIRDRRGTILRSRAFERRRTAKPQRQRTSLPPGLILWRKLLAGLDPERRIRRQDTIGIHVLVREVDGILGDDAAGELERCGIQREALDNVQLATVGE